jgi:hypothetical protein
MVAETLTSNQAGSKAKVYKQYIAGMTHTAFGTYSVAANVEDGDIFEMCKVPAGALVVGGAFWCTDMDTGTETLDIDVGWADNGGASETITVSDETTYTNMFAGAADPDGFVNSGVLTGDVNTDLTAAGHNYRPFVMSAGPVYFAKETTVQVEANAVSAAFAAGTMYVEVRYLLIG